MRESDISTKYISLPKSIVIFVQYSVAIISVLTPSGILNISGEGGYSGSLLGFLYLYSWLYSVNGLFFEAAFVSLLNLVFIVVYVACVIMAYQKKTVYRGFLFYIRFYQQFFSKVIISPIIYMISFSVENFLFHSSSYDLIGLTLSVLNYTFFSLMVYICSVFLDPSDVDFRSQFDMFDGKSEMVMFFCQSLTSISSFFFNISDSIETKIVFITAQFSIAVLILYKRVFSVVFISQISLFLEVSPFFAAPFILIIHIFSIRTLFVFISYISVITLFGILNVFYRQYSVNKSIKLFMSFSDPDTFNYIIKSNIFCMSMVTVIRNVSLVVCDPDVLVLLLKSGQHDCLKNSVLNEMCRYLCLFPSNRGLIYALLKNRNPKKLDNKWINLYIRIHIKKLYQKSKANFGYVEDLIDSFLIHRYNFWVKNKGKSYLAMLREYFNAVYYYHIVKYEVEKNIRVYPYNSLVYRLYGFFLVVFDANYNGYLKISQIESNIKHNKCYVSDPDLCSMIIRYPKLLRYLKSDDLRNTNLHNIYFNSISTDDNLTSNNMNNSERLEDNIESNLVRSERIIPLTVCIFMIIPSIILLVFLLTMITKEAKLSLFSTKLLNYSSNITDYIGYSAVSGYSLRIFEKSCIENTCNCSPRFINIASQLSKDFYQSISEIYFLYPIFIKLLYKGASNYVYDSENCFDYPSDFYFNENILESFNISQNIGEVMRSLVKFVKTRYNVLFYMTLTAISFFLFFTLLLFYLIIYLLSIHKDDHIVQDHMSNYLVLSFLISREHEEAWNCLKDQFNSYNFGSHKVLDTNSSDSECKSYSHHQDDVSMIINERKDSTKWVLLIIEISFPWIVAVLFYSLIFFPLKYYTNSEDLSTKYVSALIGQMNSSIELLNMSFYILQNYNDEHDYLKYSNEFENNFRSINETLYNNGYGLFSERFSEVKCLKLSKDDQTCHSISVADTISDSILLINTNYTLANYNYILKTMIPVFVKFSVDLSNDSLPSFVQEVASINNISASTFIMIPLIGILAFYVYMFHFFKKQMPAFNSTFHFPEDYLRSKQKTIKKRPYGSSEKVIIITSINSSGRIYSISDNVANILCQDPINFLHLELDSIFVKLENSTIDLREYTMCDHKTKRIFRECSFKNDIVTKTILVEEKNTTSLNIEQNVALLSNCVPPHFAKLLIENCFEDIKFGNGTIIWIKVSIWLDKSIINKFILIINQVCSSFTKVKLVTMEYGEIILLCHESDGFLIPLLFIRDIILEISQKLKIPFGDQFPLSSSFLFYEKNITLTAINSIEPFIQLDFENLKNRYHLVNNCEINKIKIDDYIVNNLKIVTGLLCSDQVYSYDFQSFINIVA